MRTSYSRRELYALGEPIGDSATRIEAGRRVYGGGGGIPIVSDVVDAVSDIGGGLVDAVGDAVGGAGDLVGSAVNTVGNAVGDTVDWAAEHPLEAAALAAGAYYGLPALMGEGAGAAGAMGAAEGAGGLGGWDAAMADLAGSAGMGDVSAGIGSLGGYDAAMADLAGSSPMTVSSALDAGMGAYPMEGVSPGIGGALDGWDAAMADLAGSAGMGDVAAASGTGLGSWLSNLFGGSGSSGSGLTGMGALAGLGGLAGIMGLLNADKGKYGVPGRQAYTGPMSQFKYSPSSFSAPAVNPNMFRPYGSVRTVSDAMMQQQYGGGQPFGMGRMRGYDYGFGPQMPYGGMGYGYGYGYDEPYFFAEGGETSKKPKLTPKAKLAAMDPWTRAQAELGNAAYRAQLPTATATLPPPQPLGQLNMARGGISDLGGYSDGGRMLKGPGDGMSDSIPAKIGGKREARLADGEFVVPADVVSHLGNGSTDAGAKQLYKMMDRVRAARTGHKRQGKQINADKFTPK